MKQLFAAVLLMFGMVAAEEFTDDFSQGGANTSWLKSSESLGMKFENGACTITNSDGQYSASAYHTLSSPPETFTLGATVTLTDPANQSAGLICCLASSGMATGYYVSIARNELVSVDKMGSSGTGTNMLAKRSAYITNGANKLQISRKDSVFNVFCNDRFIGTFTDKEFSKGNIALLVSTNTSAVFDNVSLTATFLDGKAPTCFADNFDDGDLIGWDSFGSEGSEVTNTGSAMKIVTGTDENIYEVIDLPLSSIVLRTTVSHRGGNTANLYGLFICGESESTIPIAGFGINGAKSYAAFNAGQKITLNPSSKVKGAAYVDGSDTTWFTDTLEVRKRDASGEYLFIVNGDTLSRFTDVSFAVTGAGIFSMDGMTIIADDFLVAQGDSAVCPIRRTVRTVPHVSRGVQGLGTIARRYDLLGRDIPASVYDNGAVSHGVTIVNGTAGSRIRMSVR